MIERDYNFGGKKLENVVDHMITFDEVVRDKDFVEAFVAQMSDYELARLSMGRRTG